MSKVRVRYNTNIPGELIVKKNELFVSCIVGIEPVLSQEITALGYTCRPGFGGVYVESSSFDDVYIFNLKLRCASRVLIPLVTFECYDKDDLYRGTASYDFTPMFSKMPTFAIDANVNHKNLTNSLFAARVVKDAICDMLREKYGKRPDVDTKTPDIRLHLFIENDKATISFDSSGEPLHQRGYRQEAGEAPLRESLAAALLLLGGYKGDEAVIDPCCGSATLLIEAAMIASNTQPGSIRKYFGFMRHPEFRKEKWEKLLKNADDAVKNLPEKQFIGIEVDDRTALIAKKAVHKAGFSDVITILVGDFREMKIPNDRTFVVANPPYGIRISPHEIRKLEELYRNLGDFMKNNTKKPAKGLIFTASLELAKCIGLKTSKRHIVNNGGIECRLHEYDLY
jgi:putative N6-adenine-specific DNA methylase